MLRPISPYSGDMGFRGAYRSSRLSRSQLPEVGLASEDDSDDRPRVTVTGDVVTRTSSVTSVQASL